MISSALQWRSISRARATRGPGERAASEPTSPAAAGGVRRLVWQPGIQMLHRYLEAFGRISVPANIATDLRTDWRDHDAEAERVTWAAQAGDALANLQPADYVSEAPDKGYRPGFTAGSVLAAEPARKAIADALKKRSVYASTGNMVADVRSGEHITERRICVARGAAALGETDRNRAFAKW